MFYVDVLGVAGLHDAVDEPGVESFLCREPVVAFHPFACLRFVLAGSAAVGFHKIVLDAAQQLGGLLQVVGVAVYPAAWGVYHHKGVLGHIYLSARKHHHACHACRHAVDIHVDGDFGGDDGVVYHITLEHVAARAVDVQLDSRRFFCGFGETLRECRTGVIVPVGYLAVKCYFLGLFCHNYLFFSICKITTFQKTFKMCLLQ